MNRRRMIQLSGGIALASMAGCLGSDDDDPGDTNGENGDGNNETDSKNGDETGGKPKNGDDAPKVDVETHDGKTVTIEARDKPTVVLFADITTEEGESHSKTLVDLHEKHHDRAYVVTISSNLDVSEGDLKEFHENHGGDWDHAMGTEDVLEKYGIEATVTVCIIDENGKVVFRAEGDVDREMVEDAIEAYSDN